MDEIGIWPRFGGRAMHDRWASYDKYAGAHSLCGAHLLRDCIYLAEQEQQAWAAEMADHLLAMHHAAQRVASAWGQLRAEHGTERVGNALFRNPGERLCGPTSSCRGRGDQTARAAEAERRQELAR